jgi:hypothetical protein
MLFCYVHLFRKGFGHGLVFEWEKIIETIHLVSTLLKHISIIQIIHSSK